MVFKEVVTEFIVNEKKRTVVCVMTTINDVPARLAKYGLADGDYDDVDFDIREYKGIAKCAPGDVWDAEFGKHLAEYRASKMRKADVNQELQKYIKGIMRCVDNLYDYGMLKEPHRPKELNEAK